MARTTWLWVIIHVDQYQKLLLLYTISSHISYPMLQSYCLWNSFYIQFMRIKLIMSCTCMYSSKRNVFVFISDSEIKLISKNGFTCNIYRNLEQVGHYLDRIHNSERGVWPLPITRYTRLISHTRFVLDFLFTQQWAGYRLSCHYLTQRSMPWPLEPWQPFGPHCPLRGSHGV